MYIGSDDNYECHGVEASTRPPEWSGDFQARAIRLFRLIGYQSINGEKAKRS